ncbi:MAG TPA: hypothetical protein VFZ21_11965 [Gemmatimonadaceae bacterium]|nr:hypothetical protein [Gemmatimonadaceae bacterium]
MSRSHRPRPVGALAAHIASVGLALSLVACDESLAPGIEIALSEPTVDFRAVRGSGTTESKTITVSNSGDGRLGPVSCPASPASWLACSVANGNTVTLTANASGLTASPATVSVPITAAGAPDRPRSVAVNLIIDQPVLTLSAASVSFAASDGSAATTPASATINATNTGAGTLASLGTISCIPTPANPRVSCTVNQGTGVLTFAVNPVGLAPGTHIFPVVVSAPNDDVEKTVSVTLAMSALPRIVLSQGSLLFQMLRGGATPDAQTVTVSNGGGGSIGTVSCPSSPATWLTCGVSNNATITFTVNPANLSASPPSVSVPISATGATNTPQNVNVSFNIRQPVLSVDLANVAFTTQAGGTTTNPASAKVVVTNTGEGALADLGTITCTPPTPSPVTCVVVQNSGELTFTVNPTGIVGTRVVPVAVTAPNSSVSRVVTVTITSATGIGLSPSEVNFQAIRGSTTDIVRKVKVSNTGAGLLGTITCPASPAAWLTCAVVNVDTLYLTAKPTGLTTSPAEVQVPVTAAGAFNSPQNVTVNFTILQPVLSLSASIVNLTVAAGGTAGPTVVNVTNTGAGNLANLGTIACTPSAARVTCAINQATGALSISVNTALAPALAPGQHVFTVSVSAPNMSNSAQTVTIVLTVT